MGDIWLDTNGCGAGALRRQLRGGDDAEAVVAHGCPRKHGETMKTVAEMPNVIVADNDAAMLTSTADRLASWGYGVRCAQDTRQLHELLAVAQPDLVVLDLHLAADEPSRRALLSELMESADAAPVVVVTALADVELAVGAVKLGAFDYFAKPTDWRRLKRVAASAVGAHRAKHSLDRPADDELDVEDLQAILGTSVAICRTRELIADVAPTDSKVLILGESGTGKELAARALHRQSRRANQTFAPVNMAALPQTLAESVLFGHEKGAFTGAETRQRGWCEMADKGTLFLDEIGEMDLALQAKLLRFLQDGTFQRIGSTKLETVDVRIIAATNRDPMVLVREGRLREDLYYRLNVLPIAIPPLRERREDIFLLAGVFLERAAKRHLKPVSEFTPAAMDVIVGYDWPGNVRQLENTIERLVVLARGSSIGIDDLPTELIGGSPVAGPMLAPETLDNEPPAVSFEMRDIEKDAIVKALSQSCGNVVRAARILGLGQATVYRKMKRYGIRVERTRREARG